MLQLAEGLARDHKLNQEQGPWHRAKPQERKQPGCLVTVWLVTQAGSLLNNTVLEELGVSGRGWGWGRGQGGSGGKESRPTQLGGGSENLWGGDENPRALWLASGDGGTSPPFLADPVGDLWTRFGKRPAFRAGGPQG